jgi:hypothetical protein
MILTGLTDVKTYQMKAGQAAGMLFYRVKKICDIYFEICEISFVQVF